MRRTRYQRPVQHIQRHGLVALKVAGDPVLGLDPDGAVVLGRRERAGRAGLLGLGGEARRRPRGARPATSVGHGAQPLTAATSISSDAYF